MPFTKAFEAPNGATLTFHKVIRIEASNDLSSFTATVASWPTEADYVAGKGAVWNSYETRSLDEATLTALQNLILSTGDFENASIIPDAAESLEAIKLRKRAQINLAREMAKSKPLVTPYGVFDAEKEDRDNVADTYALLKLVVERGGADTTDFTLYDDTIIQLTLMQLGDVALLLGVQIQTAYGLGRVLKAQVEAATTAEEVEAVQWPTN